ncbi:MAG: hypothetical protein QXL94_01790 [Candidatus Parvarchaeum sp.]
MSKIKENISEECTPENPRTCELLTTIGLMAKVAEESKMDISEIESLSTTSNLNEDKIYSCLCSLLDKLPKNARENGEIIMELGFPGRPCPGVTASHAEP